jgi:hypothetical protein
VILISYRYDKGRFGALKFKNLYKFTVMLRGELGQMGFFKRREEAGADATKEPPKPKADTKTAPLFEYTADTVDACAADKLGLCIFGILDGSPMNDAKEAQLKVLQDVQNQPSNKGRILHFMWVDSTCHPSFGDHFGVSLDTLPAVLAISPKKQAWAQHFGAFEVGKVRAWSCGGGGGGGPRGFFGVGPPASSHTHFFMPLLFVLALCTQVTP